MPFVVTRKDSVEEFSKLSTAKSYSKEQQSKENSTRDPTSHLSPNPYTIVLIVLSTQSIMEQLLISCADLLAFTIINDEDITILLQKLESTGKLFSVFQHDDDTKIINSLLSTVLKQVYINHCKITSTRNTTLTLQDKISRHLQINHSEVRALSTELPPCLPVFFTPSSADWADLSISKLRATMSSKTSSALNQYFDRIGESNVATPAHFHRIDEVCKKLFRLTNKSARTTSIELFGSSRSGLCGPSSDADISCIIPDLHLEVLAAKRMGGPHPVETMQAALLDMEEEYNRLTVQLRQVEKQLMGIRECTYLAFRTAASAVPPTQGLQLLEMLRPAAAAKDCSEREAMALQNILLAQMSSIEMARAQLLGMDGKGKTTTVATQQKLTKKILNQMGRQLVKEGYRQGDIIAHARVGLIKFVEPTYGLAVDLVPNRSLAIYNSDLIRQYLLADKSGKVKRLIMVWKGE